MRSDLALIKTTLYYYIQHEDYAGLCFMISRLIEEDFLNIDEAFRLRDLFKENKPEPKAYHYSAYWFKTKQERILFLRSLIDKLQGFEDRNPSLKQDKRIKLIKYKKEELPF